MKSKWNVIVIVAAMILLAGCPQLPKIIEQPVSQTVSVGANVQFSVGVENAETIGWLKDDIIVADAGGEILSLPVVTENDAGQYRAFAKNSAGCVYSNVATLMVIPSGEGEGEDECESENLAFDFSGLPWTKKCYPSPVGPGPNSYSPKNAWVDDSGVLHLAVKEQDGKWQSSEVILDQSFGYGVYIVQLKKHYPALASDSYLVFGIFLWDDTDTDPNNREIDFFEFSQFGNAADENNCQYAVPPCGQCLVGMDNCNRFHQDINADITTYLIWSPGKVEMRTYQGKYLDSPPTDPDTLIKKWSYEGPLVPTPGEERVHLNLWQFEGKPPSNGATQAVLISGFAFQPTPPDWPDEIKVTTNLTSYPLTTVFDWRVTQVQIGDQVIPTDKTDLYGKILYLATLQPGTNEFVLQGQDDSGNKVGNSITYKITCDQSLTTTQDELLYMPTEDLSATLVVNLTKSVIWGALPEVIMLAGTPDGQYVVDVKGNVYQTSDHTLNGDPLPFPASISTNDLYYASDETTSYYLPLFSADSRFCYLENNKYDITTRTLLDSNFPINVDGGYNTVRLNNGTLSQVENGSWNLVDLSTDTLNASVMPVSYGHHLALTDPLGNYFFQTSYSSARGSVSVYDLHNFQHQFGYSGLGDFAGAVDFLPDSSLAFIGAGGNPYYGKGEIAVYSFADNAVVSRYAQYGAYYVKVGPDGLVYARSAYNYNNGSLDHQGIEVLRYDSDTKELSFVKTYFLGNSRDPIGQQFFIKPPAVN